MKHIKEIKPSDPSAVHPENLPDKSSLSKLYVTPINKRSSATGLTQPSSPTPAKPKLDDRQRMVNRPLASLWLSIPLIVTYLTTLFIYQGAEASLAQPDPSFPLARFFISALCVLTWIISARILLRQFDVVGGGLGVFVVAYLFYLFPALDIVYGGSLQVSIGVFFTSALWVVFNFFTVFYITWAFDRQDSSSIGKVGIAAIPVLILVSGAIFT